MLTAELGRAPLAAVDLAAQVEFELPRKGARGLGGHGLLHSDECTRQKFGSKAWLYPQELTLPTGTDRGVHFKSLLGLLAGVAGEFSR
jgi:hypothetical protein